MAFEMIIGVAMISLAKLLQLLPRLLDKVDLRTGYGRGGDEAAVFGTNQGQIAFSGIGTVLGCFEFPLESADPGYTLLGHALLLLELSLIDADFLIRLVQRFL